MESSSFKLKHREKLVRCGDKSSLYKSEFYPYIRLVISDTNEVTADCNDIDVDPQLMQKWMQEVDNDLDELLKRIDQEYGERAPGFNDGPVQLYVEPVFQDLKWNPERELTIITWGKRRREQKPKGSQANFNAEVIINNRGELKLKKMTGLNQQVQQLVKTGSNYIQFMRSIITKIETDNLSVISINCLAGKHRSVSCAEILKAEFYPQATVQHLELG